MREGQGFGERALMKASSRRAASAHACGRVVVHIVSREMLVQALGVELEVRG
jgi:hypothetical protein